jgi:LysM repeat protein
MRGDGTWENARRKAGKFMIPDLNRRVFLCRLASLLGGTFISSIVQATPPPEKGAKHTVEKGETVWGIARKYGVDPQEILQLNRLEKPYTIYPGQSLLIPGTVKDDPPSGEGNADRKHVVQKGETVWSISRKYNTTPTEIIELNDLKKPYHIYPSDELTIRGSSPSRSRQQGIAWLCRLPDGVRGRRWRYIIIHHSATRTGNAAIFDSHHRRLGMTYGLAYHFVIGNGTGSGDGEIEVGGRWKRQLHGGHVRSRQMNEIAIGICLVGDFNKTYPTRRQMENLVPLVQYLMNRYNVPKKKVVGHRDVQSTDCPGKNLSLTSLRGKL